MKKSWVVVGGRTAAGVLVFVVAAMLSVLPFAPSVARAATVSDTYSNSKNVVSYASISASGCDSASGTTCNITAGEAVKITWSSQGSIGYVYASWTGHYVENGGSVTKTPTKSTTYYIYVAPDKSLCEYGPRTTCNAVTVQINVDVSAALTFPPTPASQMHVSYGRVSASGSVLSGSGDFNVTLSRDNSANGYVPVFKITFNAGNFSHTPVVLVDADYIGTCGSYSNMAFRARMNYVSYDAASDKYTAEMVTGARECYTNVPFSFIAIGPSNSPNTNSVGVAFGEFNANGTKNITVANSGNWTSYLALAGNTYAVKFDSGVFTGTPTVIANDLSYVDCTATMGASATSATFTERHDNCTNIVASSPSTFIAVGPTSNAAYSMANWHVAAVTFGGSNNITATTGGLTTSYNTSAPNGTAYFPSGLFSKTPTVVASPHPGPFTGDSADWDRVNFCAAASSMSAANTTIQFTGDGNQNSGDPDLCTYSNHTPSIGTDLIAIGPSNANGGTVTVTSEDSVTTSTLVDADWSAAFGNGSSIADPCTITSVPCSGTEQRYSNVPTGIYGLPPSLITSLATKTFVLHSVQQEPVAQKSAGNPILSFLGNLFNVAKAKVVCGWEIINGTATASTCPNDAPYLSINNPGDTANFIILWDPVAAISAKPSAVSLNAAAGSSTSTQIKLTNSGATSSILNWWATTSSTSSWLSVWPTSGCLTAGGKAVKGCSDTNGYEYVTLTANASNLGAGTYTGTVTFNGTSTPTTAAKVPNNPTIVAVTLTIGAPPLPPPPNPPSCTFGASPQQIIPPEPSTLSWSCANAVSCTLSGGEFGSGQGEFPTGSVSVSPTTNTTYTLTCLGSGSGPTNTVTTQATITTRGSNVYEINP